MILNCPDLVEFEEGVEVTMGDLTLKLVEVANQYYLCQASALKLLPEKPEKLNVR